MKLERVVRSYSSADAGNERVATITSNSAGDQHRIEAGPLTAVDGPTIKSEVSLQDAITCVRVWIDTGTWTSTE